MPGLLIVVLGSASAYYAVFGVVAIASLGLVLAVRRWSVRPAVRPVVVSAAVMAVVVANVAGEAARRGGDAGVRVPLDSDSFGLRITQMLLPIRDHRIGALADWADRAYRVAAPGDRGAPLGLLALVGVVALLVWCVRRLGRPVAGADLFGGDVPGRSAVLARLGVMTLAVLAFGAVGGLGMVLATVGVTQIRAWSRISIVVGFVGVAVLAMLFDALSRRWSAGRPLRWAAAAPWSAFAVFDQFGTSLAAVTGVRRGHVVHRPGARRRSAGGRCRTTRWCSSSRSGTYPAELPLGIDLRERPARPVGRRRRHRCGGPSAR